MEHFIESFTQKLGQYVPSVIGALVIFILGFVLARLVRLALTSGFTRLGWDAKLKEKMGCEHAPTQLITNVAYYLILLYAALVALGMLGIEGVLDPVKGMLTGLLGAIPNIIAAGLIGIAGYVAARIVAGLVRGLSGGLDAFSERVGFGKEFKLSKFLGTLVFVIIFVPVLIAALDALKIEAISGPATRMLARFLDFVPNLVAAGVILGVALVVGRFVCGLLANLLKNAGIESTAQKLGIAALFGQRGAALTIGNVVLFFIMLGAALSAVETLQLDRLAQVLGALLAFTGNVVLGLVIIAVGGWLANFACQRLQKAGRSGFTAGVARVAIIGFVIALGLRAMGIGEDIVNLAFGLTLGAVAVAVALSFGLGGREAAGKLADHWLAKWRDGDKQ